MHSPSSIVIPYSHTFLSSCVFHRHCLLLSPFCLIIISSSTIMLSSSTVITSTIIILSSSVLFSIVLSSYYLLFILYYIYFKRHIHTTKYIFTYLFSLSSFLSFRRSIFFYLFYLFLSIYLSFSSIIRKSKDHFSLASSYRHSRSVRSWRRVRVFPNFSCLLYFL